MTLSHKWNSVKDWMGYRSIKYTCRPLIPPKSMSLAFALHLHSTFHHPYVIASPIRKMKNPRQKAVAATFNKQHRIQDLKKKMHVFHKRIIYRNLKVIRQSYHLYLLFLLIFQVFFFVVPLWLSLPGISKQWEYDSFWQSTWDILSL